LDQLFSAKHFVCFSSVFVIFLFFLFRAVDEASYHSAFQHTLNISCSVGRGQIPLRYPDSEPARASRSATC